MNKKARWFVATEKQAIEKLQENEARIVPISSGRTETENKIIQQANLRRADGTTDAVQYEIHKGTPSYYQIWKLVFVDSTIF